MARTYYSESRPFSAPVSINNQNRAAHGGVCYVECRGDKCRLVNSNQSHVEYGPWRKTTYTVRPLGMSSWADDIKTIAAAWREAKVARDRGLSRVVVICDEMDEIIVDHD